MARLLALLAALGMPPIAAFGPNGHRIVADIAYRHMTPAARSAVGEVLGGRMMAAVATWPDDMRDAPDQEFWSRAAHWHFVNVPPGESYEESPKDPEGDAYVKLREFLCTLQDPAASPEEQAFAMKWVIHLVGDLHQPLHLGYAKDHGGNSIRVTWFGEPGNLHEVWDIGLIEYESLSYTEYAAFIDPHDEAQIEEWQSASILEWVNESLELRQRIYDLPGDSLGYQYAFENAPLEHRQLAKAGVRLAGLLNGIYEDRAGIDPHQE